MIRMSPSPMTDVHPRYPQSGWVTSEKTSHLLRKIRALRWHLKRDGEARLLLKSTGQACVHRPRITPKGAFWAVCALNLGMVKLVHICNPGVALSEFGLPRWQLEAFGKGFSWFN